MKDDETATGESVYSLHFDKYGEFLYVKIGNKKIQDSTPWKDHPKFGKAKVVTKGEFEILDIGRDPKLMYCCHWGCRLYCF